jgi:hypothetical protein
MSQWSAVALDLYIYEGESVNRTQMAIKRKSCDIRTWKKHLFLDISSTNINTLVLSLYQCFETLSTKVFWLLPQSLPHLVGHRLRLSNVLEKISRPSCELLKATNTSHSKQETFLYEYPLRWIFWPQKRTTESCSSVVLLQFVTYLLTLLTWPRHPSSDSGFPWFCLVPPGKYQGSTRLGKDRLLTNPL